MRTPRKTAQALVLFVALSCLPGTALARSNGDATHSGGDTGTAATAPSSLTPASTAIADEPWNGLAVVKMMGRTGDTRYTVSVTDVDPLSAVGDHDHVESGGFELRLEWASTPNNTSGTKATGALLELRLPDGRGQHGVADWHCAVNLAPSGVCTRRAHLDNDPLDGTFGAPRHEGDLEVYLRLNKTDQRGTTLWEADSRGALGGAYPRRTTHARGILNAPWGGAGHMLGSHVGTDLDHKYDDLSCPDAEQRLGDDLGRRAAAIRIYYQWQTPHAVRSCVAKAFGAGLLPVVSHKPGPGGWKAWADNTASSPTIRELARWYKQFDREFVMIFHHEPNNDANTTSNTPYHYRQAQKTAKRIFQEEGTKVTWGYSFTSKAFVGSPAGSADPFYAGDSTIDLEMYDGYNWYKYHRTGWRSFAQIYKVAVETGKRRGNFVMPAEYGSHPSSNGNSRDQWFRDAAKWMRNDADARTVMIGAVMYHSDHVDDHGRSEWTIDGKAGGGWAGYQDAFINGANRNDDSRSYFKSTPIPLR